MHFAVMLQGIAITGTCDNLSTFVIHCNCIDHRKMGASSDTALI